MAGATVGVSRGAFIGLLATAATLLLSALMVGGCGGDGPASTTIDIRYSKFAPQEITARAGEPITITIRNDDPIEHEWIVGTAAVHERHRTGTEPVHNEIPTEVTIPEFAERTTTITFDTPGDYQFICHLPNHEAYGMVGTLRVVGG